MHTQRSEARLLRAIDNQPDGVALYDETDRWLACNNTYRERFIGDVSLHPHVGRTFREILETNYAQGEVVTDGSEEGIEERAKRHARADGAPVVFNLPDGSNHVSRDFRMHDGGIRVLVSNHTEWVKREARLNLTEQRLRDFLETAADWFWETDAEGRFTSVSDQYYGVTDFEPHAVIGQCRDGLPGTAEAEDGRARLNEMMGACEVVRHVMYTRTDARGQKRHLRISGKLLFDESGAFLGYRGTGNDVTSTEQARADARRSEARFKDSLEYSADGIALYDAEDQLVAWNKVYFGRYMPSAEPLHVGMTFEAVMKRGLSVGTLSNAAEGSEHSVHIMNSLLEITRVRIPERQQFRIKPLLDASIEALQAPPEMLFHFSGEADAQVYGGPNQLRQVLTNLLLNAVEASPVDAAIQIRVGQTDHDSDIEICDEGPGIPPSEHGSIFEPVSSSKNTGSGLGLWISCEIARRHDGKLSVRNKVDANGSPCGACFTLTLPDPDSSGL